MTLSFRWSFVIFSHFTRYVFVSAVNKKRLVNCPSCGNKSEFSSENPYRPFCSERCKLIDLGDWADENYRIPDTAPPDIDDTDHAN